MRSTREVLEDHLERRRNGDMATDIKRNYCKDVIMLSGWGVFKGRKGVGQSAALLEQDLKDGDFTFTTVLVRDCYAFLEWTGTSKDAVIRDGADSFVIRDGKIVFQSVHYTVTKRRNNG